MERWDNLNGERVESEKVDAFIAEIVAVRVENAALAMLNAESE